MAKQKWFVSHPSQGLRHSPMFFETLSDFAKENQNIELILPHRMNEGVIITKQEIEDCDLVLAEVSMASTGSGIELGWANAAGKTIIAFYQGVTPVSPSVSLVATALHIYLSKNNIIKVLETLL